MPKLLCEKQELSFDEDDCPIKIGSGKNSHFVLSESVEVAREHLEITYYLNKYYVKNTSDITVYTNGGAVLKPGDQKALKSQNFFIFGKPGSGNEIFVTYNDSEDSDFRFENITIRTDPIKNESEILVSKFYADLNTQNVSNYICYFLSRHFHITTAMIILHHQEQNGSSKWVNSSDWRRDRNRRYRPSMKLLKEFIATGNPVKFDIKEDEDSTFSIVSNKIQKAFFFPLRIHDRVFGALYIDTDENILSEKDFYKISYLLENGVSAILKISLENKESKPERPLCDNLIALPFKARIQCEKHKFFVLSHRSYENMHRFIFADPRDMELAIRIKNFTDGLQRGNWNMDTVVHYSKLISEYSSLPSCDIAVEYSTGLLKVSMNKSSGFHAGLNILKNNVIEQIQEEEELSYFELNRETMLIISPNENFMEDRLEIAL